MIKTNTKLSGNTKSNRLYALLKGKIEDGSYAPGEQLPSCRRLAEEHDVSYVTASQALKSLVGEGLARNLRGRGVFVPDAGEEQPEQRLVTLICIGTESPQVTAFQLDGARLFAEAGWTVRQLLVSEVTAVMAELEDFNQFFVLFGFNFAGYRQIIDAVERLRAQRRVVVLGERCERYGIASIIADEPQLVRSCMRMLQQRGHERVGLWVGNVANSVDQERLAAWRHFYPDKPGRIGWQELFFDLNITSEDGDDAVFARRYLERMVADGAFARLDALICPGPRLAAEALNVLFEHGIRVPEDVSLVCIGDADYLRLLRPQMTVVEPGFAEHLQAALQILEERVRGVNQLPLLHLCEPKLILRASVKS